MNLWFNYCCLINSNHHKIFIMITIIPEAPENVAAFNATGEVTKEDFENW